LLYHIYMKQINIFFSLYTFTALIIIIERLSPTTRILLQPYNFIRLHEFNQTVIFLLVSVLISCLILKSVTNNFQTLKTPINQILALFFVLGAYLFGAGEGWHEVASFTLNQYCNIHAIVGNLCGGLFINSYYTGNIIFFIGGILMNFSLLALSAKQPVKQFSNRDMTVLLLNSLIYAFTWFAYAAFDTVLVGLFFSTILLIISLGFFLKVKTKFREYPYITYSTVAYTVATIGTILFRFR
jgi:hypothetical protein